MIQTKSIYIYYIYQHFSYISQVLDINLEQLYVD